MKLNDVKHIAVIGSGTMGHGIAELAGLAGYTVTMQDISEEVVNKGYDAIKWSLDKLAEKNMVPKEQAEAAAAAITPVVDLEEAVKNADVVIEAAPEIMKLKKEIFEKLDKFTPDHAILASNTSSLSITDIGRMTKRPEKVVGMHFFNPPVKMALVEVIKGEDTATEVMDLIYELSEKMGKAPVRVVKDVRGFIVNRVLVGPFMFEAGWLVDRGVATIEQIDSRMKFHEGFPMGPFELQDLTGIDIGAHLMEEAGVPIPNTIGDRVKEGAVGRKAGRGFYTYEGGEGANCGQDDGKDFDPLPIYSLMVNEASWLLGNDVTTPEEIDIAVRMGAGFPEGILRRADKLGLDNILACLEKLYADHGEERYKPDDFLKKLVADGKTGQAAGAGFYSYGGGEQGEVSYHAIQVEVDKDTHVAWITLNRPDRLNAINEDMRNELPHAFERLNKDDNVRAIVIQGAGDKAFSAGADITEFSAGKPYEFAELGEFFTTPADSPKPVIAAIDGYCLGGGMELSLSCDFRVASKRSELGQPEIHLGLIPGGGGTQRLARLCGTARAKELCMMGDRFSADQAYDWNIINHVYEDGEFEAKVKDFAENLAARAPVAVRFTKRVIDLGTQASKETALLLEREAFGLLFTTEDMNAGVTAFLTKQKPEFKGK